MKKIYYVLFIVFILIGCKNNPEVTCNLIAAPNAVANRAYSFAELYEASQTEYKLGGQDPVRSIIRIDCSGLIIMCYKYAIVDMQYELLETDMTANYIYENASEIISKEQLRKGDLIFMGEEGSTEITHIALFHKIENDYIYFIDSTQKDINNDGINDIDGVTYRFYPKDDKRFKSFGIMLLREM